MAIEKPGALAVGSGSILLLLGVILPLVAISSHGTRNIVIPLLLGVAGVLCVVLGWPSSITSRSVAGSGTRQKKWWAIGIGAYLIVGAVSALVAAVGDSQNATALEVTGSCLAALGIFLFTIGWPRFGSALVTLPAQIRLRKLWCMLAGSAYLLYYGVLILIVAAREKIGGNAFIVVGSLLAAAGFASLVLLLITSGVGVSVPRFVKGTRRQGVSSASWAAKCPVCKQSALEEIVTTTWFGLQNKLSCECPACHAKFVADGPRFRLVYVSDTTNQVWVDYRKQSLTPEEWENICGGGLSAAKQYEVDMSNWLAFLKDGKVSMNLVLASGPVSLRRNECLTVVLPNIDLWEPRSIRYTTGVSGGPSFRIAKGVYWRVGGFGARTVSSEQLKCVDTGTLTITNERLVFSGAKRSFDSGLHQIVSIEPYRDGIAVSKSGRSKTQLFAGVDRFRLRVVVGGREYNEPLSGVILKFLVEGLLKLRAAQEPTE